MRIQLHGLRIALVTLAVAGFAAVAAAQATNPPAPPSPATPVEEERANIEAAFARADADGDGKLSVQEAARLPAVAAKFDNLDRDKDGFISHDEFVTGVRVQR